VLDDGWGPRCQVPDHGCRRRRHRTWARRGRSTQAAVSSASTRSRTRSGVRARPSTAKVPVEGGGVPGGAPRPRARADHPPDPSPRPHADTRKPAGHNRGRGADHLARLSDRRHPRQLATPATSAKAVRGRASLQPAAGRLPSSAGSVSSRRSPSCPAARLPRDRATASRQPASDA